MKRSRELVDCLVFRNAREGEISRCTGDQRAVSNNPGIRAKPKRCRSLYKVSRYPTPLRGLQSVRQLFCWALIALPAGCDSLTPQPVVNSQAAVSPDASTTDGAVLPTDATSTNSPAAFEFTDDDITAPPLNNPPSESNQSPRVEIEHRAFATLQPLTTDQPEALLEHLRQIDAALQDLVLAGSSNFVAEKEFTDGGLRLGRMKLAAGKQLTNSPTASDEQRKAGVIAQLVALSHMSGLRDVGAAQQLERFAKELAASGDADLAHQARVVLIGFELQALQNGLHQQPDALLAEVAALFPRPQDRGFPEFMVLQQAQQVLTQMGFAEAAQQIKRSVIDAYRTSPDSQLRGEAWLVEVQSSQAYLNFLQAFRSLGTDAFDTPAALVAVRGLYEAFPNMQTLEQIATTIANIEYSGYVPLSQDVASFTKESLSNHASADQTYVNKALGDHATRMKLLNSPAQLEGLVGFDGQALNWNEYAGKIVLVDFWASWCVKCLREIPAIRQVHAEFAEQGFAVISVNMDENLANGREFVQQQSFPWRSFHSDDPTAIGFQSALARQMGVNAIPFMMLIDRDGRIAALHVRGPQLRPAVEKLIVPKE